MKPRRLIAVVLCALLIAYPLSFGPVVAGYYKGTAHPPRWMEGFYVPIGWLCSHSDTVNAVFTWYMWLWIPKDISPSAVP